MLKLLPKAVLIAVFAVLECAQPADSQSATNLNLISGSPTSAIFEVVNGLLSQRIKDSGEIRYFTRDFALVSTNYLKKYGREFDADVLLGVQDWSSLSIKNLQEVYLGDKKAIVIAVLHDTYIEKGGEQKIPDMILRYILSRVDGSSWKIDDIMYNDLVSFRDFIAHANWCEVTAKRSGKNPNYECGVISISH
jgi:hypothetical protein